MSFRPDDKWFQEHPKAAEKIRQAEKRQKPKPDLDATQTLPIITPEMIAKRKMDDTLILPKAPQKNDALGSRINVEKEAGNMFVPVDTKWRGVALVASLIVLIVGGGIVAARITYAHQQPR